MSDFSQSLYEVVEAALSLLPDSPFVFLEDYSNSAVGEWLGYLNWFIPINTFIVILQTWVSCILTYYVIQIILRWAKAIE